MDEGDIGDLHLLQVAGLEVIDQDDEQLMEYFRALGVDEMKSEELVDKGMHLREEGQTNHERGNLDQAMEQFKKSQAAFVELYQREGSTWKISQKRLFALLYIILTTEMTLTEKEVNVAMEKDYLNSGEKGQFDSLIKQQQKRTKTGIANKRQAKLH